MKVGTRCLLFFLSAAAFTVRCLAVTSCAVAEANEVTDAEKAFLRGHFETAAGLYQARLKETPCFAIPTVSRNAGVEVSGFSGASTLSKMIVSIDYPDGLVKFDYDPNHVYANPQFK